MCFDGLFDIVPAPRRRGMAIASLAGMSEVIAALFDSLEDAGRAEIALLVSGLPPSRLCLSRSMTEDGLAAEAPGQSYENQTGEDPAVAKFAEAVRGAVYVMNVAVRSRDEALAAAALLQANGARGGILHVPPLATWR
jgi:hypothetical protein